MVYLYLLLSFFAYSQEDALRESVSRMAELERFVEALNETDCTEDNKGFTRVHSGLVVACASYGTVDGIDTVSILDCTGDGKSYPGGHRFLSGEGHPHVGAASPYGSTSPQRSITFWSRNGALNETFLYLNDMAGGPDSHDVKSAVFLLPRSVVPSAKVVGDNIEMTMTTGEKVLFDRRTNAIKGGALREGPIDLTTDRFRRQPPNVHYQGTGISIRMNHRFEDPLQSAESAEVKQGNRTCRVPRATLFDGTGKLRTSSDAELVQVLNASCPQGQFRI